MSLFNSDPGVPVVAQRGSGIKIALIVVLVASVIGSMFAFSPQRASAQAGNNGGVSRMSSMSPESIALSFVYYKALRTCLVQSQDVGGLENLTLNSISAEGAKNYKWFFGVGTALTATNVGLIGDPRPGPDGDGRHTCFGADQGERFIKELVSLTGYPSGPAFLCAIGFNRQTEATNTPSRCPVVTPGITNDFRPPVNIGIALDDWWQKVIGASSLNAGGLGPGQYVLYYGSFTDESNPCGIEKVSSNDSVFDYRIFGPSADGGSLVEERYIISDSGKSRTSSVQLYSGTSRNCGDLAAQIALPENPGDPAPGSVVIFREWLKLSPENSFNLIPGIDEQPGTSGSNCVVEGVGWAVCPLINALGGLSDGMFGWISSILVISPLQQNDADGSTSAQYETWQVVRNLANVVLVIAFLIIIFSQLTGAGISNYGVKKTLPRMIMIAIAINLSFLIMQLLIDLTNIVGVGVKVILDSAAVLDIVNDLSFARTIEQLVAGTFVVAAAAAGAAGAFSFSGIGPSTLVLLALPFIITAALSLFAAIATLFLRNALVIVLAIISPLAFAAYLLPNTQELFTKWRKLFTSMLLIYPMAALLFGGANFAAYVVLASNQPFATVIALFIIAAPLGALPFLIKSSNSVLAGVGNKLQGFAKAAKNPLQRGLQSRVDNSKLRNRAGERSFLGRKRNADAPGAKRTMAQSGAARQLNLENDSAALKEDGSRRYKEMAEDDNRTDRTTKTARRNIDRLATAKTGNAAADSQITARQQARAATAGTADARYADRSFDATEASRVAASQIEDRSKRRVENNVQSSVSGLGLGDQSTLARAATETAKATQGRIDIRESASGQVRSAIQEQKANTLREKEEGAAQQEVFDQTVVSDEELSAVVMETSRSELGSAVAQGELNLREAKAKNVGGSMAQEEIRRRAFAQAADAKTKRMDQFQSEAATDSDARYLNFAGKDTREMLQASELELQVTRDATASAQGVGRQEYATKVQGSESLAARAAGIDDVSGPARVVAQATQVVDKARQEAIGAETVLIRDKRVDTKTLLARFTAGQNPDGNGPYTAEQAQAMVKMIVEGGGVDDAVRLFEHINGPGFDLAANPDNPRVVQMLGQTLQSTGKLKSVGAGAAATLANGSKIGSFAQQIATRAAGGKYTPEAIAGMDPYEINQLTDFFAGGGGAPLAPEVMESIKGAIAARQSDDTLKRSLNKETVDALDALDGHL